MQQKGVQGRISICTKHEEKSVALSSLPPIPCGPLELAFVFNIQIKDETTIKSAQEADLRNNRGRRSCKSNHDISSSLPTDFFM